MVGTNIVGDGVPGNADATDQDFALVVSNVSKSQGARAVLTAGSRTVTPGGDGDATLEPGEPFTLTQNLRNAGNETATAVTATASATGGTTFSVPTSNWPNIAPGDVAANSPAFAGTVAAAQKCGVPVSITMSGSTSSGALQFGFTVPIGRPSTTATVRTATDVPKAIPDNNPAGVTSVLAAGNAGMTVSDLDVTIGQITHTFVGDLTIDITSPEGTTVRLANRNGGSGDNFTDTVFDDEAATAITAGAAPFTGSFRPFQPLSAFDGQRILGNWTLKVTDLAGADVGTLSAWNTKTKGYTC